MARIDAVLRDAATRIPPDEARLLLAYTLRRDAAWLFAHADDTLSEAERADFDALVTRRARGEPVAYLTGRRAFWTFDLEVGPATLIPRPETERLVELALARMAVHAPLRVADLGTGSGAIALALASERPQAQVVATDASGAALAIAARNVATCGRSNVELREGPWWGPLRGERFDLVASNPPYIAVGDPHLARGDLRFEPPSALASGDDGLDDLRSIVGGAPAHLVPGGWLLVEHGHDQGAAVRALFEAAGFVDVATERDLEARDRITLGRILPI